MITVVIAAAAGGVGALATWLTGRRKRSGKIDTTEAATLWRESNDMRQELRGELEAARTELAAERSKTRAMSAEVDDARGEAFRAKAEAEHLREEAAAARSEVQQLRTEMARLREETDQLRQQLGLAP